MAGWVVALGLGLAAEATPPPQTTLLSIDGLGEAERPPRADAPKTPDGVLGHEAVAPMGSDLRVTLDLATRVTWDDTRNEATSSSFVGVDLLHVFSGPSGDRATLTLQGYLTHVDTPPGASTPGVDGGDWFFNHRILNLNINLLDRGRLNLRVGHFEIPFGLEQDVNTNGTLRQYTHVQNLGVKADWGASVNGVLNGVEYEAGLTRGSGNEWLNRGRPWIASGRVGVRPSAGLSVGVSAFSGEVLTANNTVRRERVGVDAAKELGPLTLLGELSTGRNEGRDVWSTLGEVNWQTNREDLLVYVQHRHLDIDTPANDDPAASFTLGARWAPDNHWALSAAVEQDTDQPSGLTRDRRLVTQVRYRF